MADNKIFHEEREKARQEYENILRSISAREIEEIEKKREEAERIRLQAEEEAKKKREEDKENARHVELMREANRRLVQRECEEERARQEIAACEAAIANSLEFNNLFIRDEACRQLERVPGDILKNRIELEEKEKKEIEELREQLERREAAQKRRIQEIRESVVKEQNKTTVAAKKREEEERKVKELVDRRISEIKEAEEVFEAQVREIRSEREERKKRVEAIEAELWEKEEKVLQRYRAEKEDAIARAFQREYNGTRNDSTRNMDRHFVASHEVAHDNWLVNERKVRREMNMKKRGQYRR